MPSPDGEPNRRTMQYWIARTLRELRESNDVSRADITVLVRGRDGKPLDQSTLSRLENGETWPQRLDHIVAAYAFLCGIEDGRDIWERALREWKRHGGAPALDELSPQQRSMLLALEAVQQRRSYDDESPGKPTSIRKKRAG